MSERAVRVYAPGAVGNLGPGLDILGLATTGAGDTVRAERSETPGVRLTAAGHPDLPLDAERNTAGLAALEVLRRSGSRFGLILAVEKGLPLAGGQGGSAASAVAGAVAANALVERPLGEMDLLAAGLAAEERVSGRHLDNVAPSLLGGVTLVRSLDPIDVVRLPAPTGLRVVLAHPEQRLRTSEGRSVLPRTLDRDLALYQAAQVAAMVAAFFLGDWALLGRALDDRIAEPARAPLLPGFREAKAAALATGALGGSISGSGPTSFALVLGDETAERVAAAMTAAYAAAGVACRARVAGIDPQGARILPGDTA